MQNRVNRLLSYFDVVMKHKLYGLAGIQFDAFEKYEWKLFSSKNFGNFTTTRTKNKENKIEKVMLPL